MSAQLAQLALRESMRLNGDQMKGERAMGEPINPQEFGEVKATVHSMKGSMDELKRDFSEMMRVVIDIKLTLAQAKGGWRVMIGIGGACSALGAGILELFHYFSR